MGPASRAATDSDGAAVGVWCVRPGPRSVFPTVKFNRLARHNLNELTPSRLLQEDDAAQQLKPFEALFKPYREDLWYMEVVECVRRVLVSMLIVLPFPGSITQVR